MDKKVGNPMKKLLSYLLTAALSLSLLTTALAAPQPPKDPEPAPTPIVTIQPVDPDKPGEPPAEPQDKLPEPAEQEWYEF